MNTPDHPDFTALALGEHIHGTPARAVLDALRTSVSARQEAEQIRDTAARLSFVLKGQPPQRLDSKRRNAILNADIAAVRARFAAEDREEEETETAPPVVRRPQRQWLYPAAAAAAVVAAAVVVLRLLPGSGPAIAPQQPKAGLAQQNGDEDPGGRVFMSSADPAATRAPARGTPAIAIAVKPQAVAPPSPGSPGPAPQPPTPAELVKQLPPAEVAPAVETPLTKPPYRHDPKDWAGPPRVKSK